MHKLPQCSWPGLLHTACFRRPDRPRTAAAPAPESPHSFTGKLGLFSEYEYRGISQTSEDPALQLNLDYAHSSGLYAGFFFSNIKWLKDTAYAGGFNTNANLEWDIYLGYKFEPIKDWTVDVGYLRYEYPRSGAFNPKPNTDEAYIGVTWGPATLKYSYSFNDTFGVPKSDGSDYLELSVTYPITDTKLSLTGVLGYQRYAGTQDNGFDNDDLSGVWKIGASRLRQRLQRRLYYKGTNANDGSTRFATRTGRRTASSVSRTHSIQPPAAQKERTHETGHGHHQAVQARRGARGALGHGVQGSRHGSEGLRRQKGHTGSTGALNTSWISSRR